MFFSHACRRATVSLCRGAYDRIAARFHHPAGEGPGEEGGSEGKILADLRKQSEDYEHRVIEARKEVNLLKSSKESERRRREKERGGREGEGGGGGGESGGGGGGEERGMAEDGHYSDREEVFKKALANAYKVTSIDPQP